MCIQINIYIYINASDQYNIYDVLSKFIYYTYIDLFLSMLPMIPRIAFFGIIYYIYYVL